MRKKNPKNAEKKGKIRPKSRKIEIPRNFADSAKTSFYGIFSGGISKHSLKQENTHSNSVIVSEDIRAIKAIIVLPISFTKAPIMKGSLNRFVPKVVSKINKFLNFLYCVGIAGVAKKIDESAF